MEIDVLTGEFTILRADILYEPGKSPNPAIDIGQIEGGYVQGVGFATTEEVVYDHAGRLVTDNIWSYKPPCSKTIPLDFRVRLRRVDEARNARRAARGEAGRQVVEDAGRAVADPGALGLFRDQAGHHGRPGAISGHDDWLTLDLPATCQRIQSLCGVEDGSLTL